MFQDNFLLYFLFNILRLLFVSFSPMFQEFSSLSHTKISLHLHSPFSLLLLYIYMSRALHANPSQIHLDKKRCHLPPIFQRHLHNSNIVVLFDPNSYEWAMTKEVGLHFLFCDGSLQF